MKIELDPRQNAFENASVYFDRAKKAKAKLASLEKAVIMLQQKKEAQTEEKTIQKKTLIKIKRTKEWFEKFHWFYTTNHFLVLAGRDKSSNEHLVKKVMLPQDVYFHSEAHGSAHGILVTNGKQASSIDLQEAAQFVGTWSGDWKGGATQTDVYSVKPEQVSKQAPTGESMGSGAFMIYGTRNWFKKMPLRIAIGVDSTGRVVSGPESAIKTQSELRLVIIPGEKKKSDLAKQVVRFFEKRGQSTSLDDVLGMIPPDGQIVAL